MKTAIKLALLGATLAAGAANAQTITNTPQTGGSDLILFVSDLTTNTFFAQDLGNPLDGILSKSKVVSDGVLTSAGSFNVPAIGGHDAALASYLGTTHSGDNVEWSIMAADASTTAVTAGAQRALVTSTFDLSGATASTFTNGNVTTFTSHLSTLVQQINTQYGGGNVAPSGITLGWGGGTAGINAPQSWLAFTNGAAIGTAQTMYAFGTNGAGKASQSNPYVGVGSVNIDALGNITVSSVPLPAAVWLFGSGLLGLVGVGRRRIASAVAA